MRPNERIKRLEDSRLRHRGILTEDGHIVLELLRQGEEIKRRYIENLGDTECEYGMLQAEIVKEIAEECGRLGPEGFVKQLVNDHFAISY
jgi:hypothetical protein